MQRPSPRFRSEEYFMDARYRKKCFTQIYRDLYVDAMLVLMSTNMADGNQQKYLLPSFASKA